MHGGEVWPMRRNLYNDPVEGRRRLEAQPKYSMDLASSDVTSSVTNTKLLALDGSRIASPDTNGKAKTPGTLGVLLAKSTQMTLLSLETGTLNGPREKNWTIASSVYGTRKGRL